MKLALQGSIWVKNEWPNESLIVLYFGYNSGILFLYFDTNIYPFCFFFQGSQILSSLSVDEYKSTLKMIEKAILATDLALYMK